MATNTSSPGTIDPPINNARGNSSLGSSSERFSALFMQNTGSFTYPALSKIVDISTMKFKLSNNFRSYKSSPRQRRRTFGVTCFHVPFDKESMRMLGGL